jgi:hypothetical protein
MRYLTSILVMVGLGSSLACATQESAPADMDSANPPGVFDQAALDAFRQFQFCPPRPGLRYPGRFRARLHFQL